MYVFTKIKFSYQESNLHDSGLYEFLLFKIDSTIFYVKDFTLYSDATFLLSSWVRQDVEKQD